MASSSLHDGAVSVSIADRALMLALWGVSGWIIPWNDKHWKKLLVASPAHGRGTTPADETSKQSSASTTEPANANHLGHGEFLLDLLAFPAGIVFSPAPPAVVASFAIVLENMI